jgi:transcriptional regulator with XRE-family HTH domain
MDSHKKGQQQDFATVLRALLAESGLSAYALAQRSGVSKQSLSRLLSGDSEPSLRTALRLCRALGVSLSEFDGTPP